MIILLGIRVKDFVFRVMSLGFRAENDNNNNNDDDDK
jgi:hypothetical protein